PTLESRAAGNAMRQINDLWLVIFSGDELFRKERVDLSKATISQVTNSRPDTDEHCTEQTTRVEFEYTVPNGRYRIYAVANVDLSDKDIRTQGDLQHIRLVWNNDPGQINSNAQMIGYFTADRNGGTASFSTVSGDEKTGYEETGALEADEITVRASTSLHAWVRRAASKITVAFDTRDLRENIYIYIKSVTVKDIPEDCYLGASNTPGALNRAEGMSNGLVDGETVYFGKADASQTDHKAHYNKWMRLTKGDVLAGLYSNANGKYGENVSYDERYAKEHSDEVPALYFYENLQGLGQEGTPSDKRQDVSGNNSQVTYPGGNNPDNEAFKDAKRKGSYVEVEAYYICEDSRNPGQGPITYRFMLGKDTKTDYNAERNHHYKLTLKFNGYANDIDWHIVYK
ncbi:MAG: hypothetical protein K2F63_06045, partial [Muribaculaceae bacterium]|nr:hypothetical protein [Muribaculaceae bacterium]